jgi:hypothetical protein
LPCALRICHGSSWNRWLEDLVCGTFCRNCL